MPETQSWNPFVAPTNPLPSYLKFGENLNDIQRFWNMEMVDIIITKFGFAITNREV